MCTFAVCRTYMLAECCCCRFFSDVAVRQPFFQQVDVVRVLLEDVPKHTGAITLLQSIRYHQLTAARHHSCGLQQNWHCTMFQSLQTLLLLCLLNYQATGLDWSLQWQGLRAVSERRANHTGDTQSRRKSATSTRAYTLCAL